MVNIACSSLIQTILSVLEFHQISRRSGSRTITAGRESQLMLITTTPKNFLLFASDYTTYRYLLSIQLFHYAPLLTLLFQAIIIPSLTVAEIKNRCIPCVYWGTAIFVVVMKYSNLFFSFAFFLDRSHFAFGYELIISSEAAGFMKIICNGFTLI